ncbi:antiviral innate immune response receptor RIG-I-like isoform X2 [Mercenaria mercenaria]|uniref:antiviral innate immune response receptor RIG-I-like isoform X2 n=1 Tax=Mercenaria mercenaria TaxID=6596 RepID=UPI00234F3890|nr:antiviral innate immune response receptor RIG-I-like isoform X2 [Mercenaria mercenaria]
MAVENRLLFFSKEVTRCIKDPTVVSHLEADSVISSDESSRLKKIYLDGDPFKANEEMIDCLLKSTAKGKWRSFLDALEKSDYLHLKSLLESTDRPRSSDTREKEIIRVFIPFLEKTVTANEIVTDLYSRKVINEVDDELIRATYQNKGDTYATIVLLERMQCRLAPDEWFYEFLSVLVQRGFKHVVKELEPDFLDCPERFRPCTGSAEAKGTECDVMNSNTETYDTKGGDDVCCSSGKVIEHMVTDYGDAEEDMDQGVPTASENDNDADEESALDLSLDSGLKDSSDKSSSRLKGASNSDINEKRCLHEIEKNTTNVNKVAKLGERAPPEGHDFDGDSSCDGGAEQTKTNRKLDDETPLAEKLYPFQLELAEKALAGKNTIICAPTGSGKTWVALYIIDRHLRSSSNGEKTKKVVFMARNGVLVSQQMDFISNKLPYAKVKHLKGDTEEALMMNAFFEDYDIFLFTPQILVNNLSKDVKSLSIFSLMVFDECHHTKGDEPYSMLMKNYLMEKSDGTKNLPQASCHSQ